MEQQKLLELLHSLTIEEKIGQLLQLSGDFFTTTDAVTGPAANLGIGEDDVYRCGSVLSTIGAEKTKEMQDMFLAKNKKIPMMFMADIINGYRTVFPIPLAQGATFNPELSKEGASIAAKEAAASGIHVTFSPMADMVRDGRWGRVMESTGEDIYLNSCFAEKMVEGYQGDDIGKKGNIAACLKHFAGYGGAVAGRDYNEVELSERTLREDYLPAYEAAIKAGVKLVMTSFNTLDRIPSSANKKLMRNILRDEMGFEDVLISDYAAINEIIDHQVAENRAQAAKLAIEAGVDIDMMTACYVSELKNLVAEGGISESLIDEAALRVLELKNELGLFENPYKDASVEDEKKLLLCPKHREASRRAAEESFVLLKNEEHILPLKKEEKVAFIGPFCEEKGLLGFWTFFSDRADTITVREGVESYLGEQKDHVSFVNGASLPILGEDWTGKLLDVKEAVEAAKNADKVVLLLGEKEDAMGEGASKLNTRIPAAQKELFDAVTSITEQVILVVFSGRPFVLTLEEPKTKAILEAWMPGTDGGSALANVLYGEISPSGKLSMSFPWDEGQLPYNYNHPRTARPHRDYVPYNRFQSHYVDGPNEPLYPFGFGLSYTTFHYSPITLDKNVLTKNDGDMITASVTVKNTGDVAGKEVVQLYLHDVFASVTHPVRSLKGFEKILLQPGEEKTVQFQIKEDMLRLWNIGMEHVSEPGAFELWIGGDSLTDNRAEFTLV